jgi:hypothetical protein
VTRREPFNVTCSDCGTETPVLVVSWPATFRDPPEAFNRPEDCPSCGRVFDADDRWLPLEPDE